MNMLLNRRVQWAIDGTEDSDEVTECCCVSVATKTCWLANHHWPWQPQSKWQEEDRLSHCTCAPGRDAVFARRPGLMPLLPSDVLCAVSGEILNAAVFKLLSTYSCLRNVVKCVWRYCLKLLIICHWFYFLPLNERAICIAKFGYYYDLSSVICDASVVTKWLEHSVVFTTK